MIRSFLYRIIEKRHFWRQASLGEIADLYAAQTLRMAAISLVSGFSSVYLYRQGYSLVFIMSFWAVYFCLKSLISPLMGMVISKTGTAVSTIISNIVYIPAIVALSLVHQIKLPGLIIYGLCLTVSATLHELCYYIDFSRVKSIAHAGKEIGYMNILTKIVITISPVLGGIIALRFNVQITMWLAGFILSLAGIPLFKLKKQVEKKHRYLWRGFPWRLALSSILAGVPMGFDVVASSMAWGLFIAVVLLPSTGNDIYAALGFLSSAAVVVAMITSSIFGKLIDSDKGGLLMRVGVGINVIVHMSRVLVSSVAGAIGVNVTNEVASTALGMSFMRGMFDIADTSGYRVLYIVVLDMVKNIGSVLACIAMVICINLVGDHSGFQMFYAITALICSTVFLCRFKIYNR